MMETILLVALILVMFAGCIFTVVAWVKERRQSNRRPVTSKEIVLARFPLAYIRVSPRFPDMVFLYTAQDGSYISARDEQTAWDDMASMIKDFSLN